MLVVIVGLVATLSLGGVTALEGYFGQQSGTAASSSSHRQAVVGTLQVPGPLPANAFTVDGNGTLTHVSRNGTFRLSPTWKPVAIVVAADRTHHLGLMSLSVQREPTAPVHLAVTPESTAEALVFLSPLLSTSNPVVAKATMAVIAKDAQVRALASKIASLLRKPPVGSQPELALEQPLEKAITSVLKKESQLKAEHPIPPNGGGSRDPGTGQCTGTLIKAENSYDATQMNIASGGNGTCDLQVLENGPAASQATTAWVATVYQLNPDTFVSPTEVQSDANNMCETYGLSQANEMGTLLVLPPTSIYDWLTDPVSSLIGQATSLDVTPYINATTPGLYIYRAYSGGGQLTGQGNLNPLWANDSCLLDSSSEPNATSLYNTALGVNVLLMALDGINPILGVTADVQGNEGCVAPFLSGAVSSVSELTDSSLQTATGVIQTVASVATPLLTGLLSCQVGIAQDTATNSIIQQLYGLSDTASEEVLAKAELPVQLGATALKAINLMEYSHPVESGFVTLGSPFANGQQQQPAANVVSGENAGDTIALPSGQSQYFYVGATSGGYPMLPSWSEDLGVHAASGNEAVSIGRSTSNMGSFSTNTPNIAIGGVGVSGYTVDQIFQSHVANVGPGSSGGGSQLVRGPQLNLTFTTSSGDMVMILVGGQGDGNITLTSLDATKLENGTYSEAGSQVFASEAIYEADLPPGTYTTTITSVSSLNNSWSSLGAVAYVLSPSP